MTGVAGVAAHHWMGAVRSIARRTSPSHAEFHVTARCHLACRQCNIVHAHADVPELTLEQIGLAAANLADIGVRVVSLTGGEPFVRQDLPEIVEAFARAGIQTWLQTAGLARRDALERCVAAGARHITVSLDTLDAKLQERINGGFAGSWDRAIESIATINEVFPERTVAVLAAVLVPSNVQHVPHIVELAGEIGWSVSVTPAHVASALAPRLFRALDEDTSLCFATEAVTSVKALVEELKAMRRRGLPVHDSDEYLDDLLRFVTGEPLRWRRRNGDVCDAPNLYFSIDPAGHVAPCRDYRLEEALPVHDERFPIWFRDGVVRRACQPLVAACDGCMYGEFREITVNARFLGPILGRSAGVSAKGAPLAKLSATRLRELAHEIRSRDPGAGPAGRSRP